MAEYLHILLRTSACLQWLCHSGERTVARGPLVFLCIDADLQQAHKHNQTVHHLFLCYWSIMCKYVNNEGLMED